MQPISRSYDPATTVLGPQEPVNIDYMPLAETFIGVFLVSGMAEYRVEFTLDDINNPDVTPRWFELKELPAGSTSTAYSRFSHPARFVRLVIDLFTGPLEFKVAQSVDALN